MAYEPTEWKSGDVVTSAKLNKLEQAVAGCSLVIHATTEDYVTTLDKTWQEIFDAFSAGTLVVVIVGETTVVHVTSVYVHTDVYSVIIGESMFTTDSASGYPVFEEGQ